MFRINNIKFHNFRNILDSTIYLAEKGFKTDIGGDIIGIYGTNGSSKSSVGYALSFLTKLMTNLSYAFFHDFNNDFGIYDDYMELEFDFDYTSPDSDYSGVKIYFKFEKEDDYVDTPIVLTEEVLTIKSDKRGRRNEYKIKRSKNHLITLIEKDQMLKLTELLTDQSIAYAIYSYSVNNQCSYFLNINSLVKAYEGLKETKQNISPQLYYLSSFITHYINNTSFIMPDSYGLSITNNLFAIIGGDIASTNLLQRNPNGYFIIHKTNLDKIKESIEISNNFISKIVPNFKVEIEIRDTEEDITGDNKKHEIRFICHNNKGKFLFENESEGIKRLFLISAAISKIMNYEDSILFIDELDEGIFEVLFGDLIKIISEQCLGQFIFTSHNLRPLEVLEYTHFIFSTVNKRNRFVTLTGIKPKNNLRDIYIRKILYGDDKELANYCSESDILEGLINGTQH